MKISFFIPDTTFNKYLLTLEQQAQQQLATRNIQTYYKPNCIATNKLQNCIVNKKTTLN